ncbi:MAG: hypothetical protein HUU06_00050 [Planctomycetaceae bacterium]|nr:hypothetical protein [Planctomycetota bacterium]NUN51168.1 hypothetical protein [Planctomycetaceae bacterium]
MIRVSLIVAVVLVAAGCRSAEMREQQDPPPARVWAPPMHGVRDDLTRVEASAKYPLSDCVVSGKPLDSMGGPVAYEDYGGNEVQFCCVDCAWEYVKRPSAYRGRLPRRGS